mmetsp:Transcript_32337/g.77590  ORF Transcript_32337/g.77590 Transcript_32337/m.77590 type:complete len:251 (+) Transcript_32337:1182-1934(+)
MQSCCSSCKPSSSALRSWRVWSSSASSSALEPSARDLAFFRLESSVVCALMESSRDWARSSAECLPSMSAFRALASWASALSFRSSRASITTSELFPGAAASNIMPPSLELAWIKPVSCCLSAELTAEDITRVLRVSMTSSKVPGVICSAPVVVSCRRRMPMALSRALTPAISSSSWARKVAYSFLRRAWDRFSSFSSSAVCSLSREMRLTASLMSEVPFRIPASSSSMLSLSSPMSCRTFWAWSRQNSE